MIRLFSCTKFQFHYGSIKGRSNLHGIDGLKGFNSTMVRLKEIPG